MRNIGIMAHIDAGKTTTTERILFYTGRMHRPGEVDDGATQMDYMEQERERGITITSAATTCAVARPLDQHHRHAWPRGLHGRGRAEPARARRSRRRLLRRRRRRAPVARRSGGRPTSYGVPRLAFINKMDRLGADFDRGDRDDARAAGRRPVPVLLPIGSEDGFRGIIDLLAMQRAALPRGRPRVRPATTGRSPPSSPPTAAAARQQLIEAAGGAWTRRSWSSSSPSSEPTPAQLRAGAAPRHARRQLVPVLCGSALSNKGVQPLLDAVVDFLPSPARPRRS